MAGGLSQSQCLSPGHSDLRRPELKLVPKCTTAERPSAERILLPRAPHLRTSRMASAILLDVENRSCLPDGGGPLRFGGAMRSSRGGIPGAGGLDAAMEPCGPRGHAVAGKRHQREAARHRAGVVDDIRTARLTVHDRDLPCVQGPNPTPACGAPPPG